MKILMVCLGNICRSPIAQGILQDKIRKNNLDWEVDSAGIDAWHVGEFPDPRSIEIAIKNGLDISDQRARKLSPTDFKAFDKIYVMDKENYRDTLLVAENDEDRAKVGMLLNLVSPGANNEIPDPYMNNDGFEEVYQLIDEACNALIKNEMVKSNS